MVKLVAVVALGFTLEGAFILHAVVASRGKETPRATVELLEVRVPGHAVLAAARR